MKKTLSFLLLVVYLISLSSVAFAEDDLSWEFYGPIAKDTFGDTAHFYTLDEVQATIWIPDYLKPTHLTEEDLASGAIACFMPADESSMVYITYYDAKDLSLESFQRALSNSGIEADIQIINGIPALVYVDVDSDTFVVTYLTAEGYFLQLMFYPLVDEISFTLFTMIISSIQPVVIEDVESVPVVPVNPVSGLISK